MQTVIAIARMSDRVRSSGVMGKGLQTILVLNP